MRLIQFPDLTAGELGAWERLADRAAEPNPFFEPGFAAIAAKSLGGCEARLLVAEGDDGEWIGCMPVKALPRRGARLAFGTWNHDYSFLGTPLVDRDCLDCYAIELVEAVEEGETGRFLVLRDVHEGPVLDALRRAIEAAPGVGLTFERTIERAAVRRRPEADYASTLKASRRKRLQGRRRKLEQAVDGELRFRDLRCEDGAAQAFLELEASGWKGEEGTAMACDPGSAEFFTAMCEWFDQRERLHMRVMEGEGGAIVMNCNVAAGNAVFSFKTAFDESFRKYAPGLLLQLDDFEAWHKRNREDYMDSCGHPDANTLNEFWPDRREITTVVVGRQGALARAAREALHFHYSPIGRRLVAMIRRRSTRLGILAGALVARYQQAIELGETQTIPL